ncbi:uncharacterized protein LOC143597876 [Bidens hawaiensis]|uniref:uncharacterized protein LOC143597876 n=1 Tax=Bidens hawaiensis TaxID=980011 RepID=UPI004048F887
MVDESQDESKKEQMAVVLRFVDAQEIIQESFLDLVHVRDTLALTLKTHLWNQLLQYQFDVSKIRGQGYDGASNMRGEWNGLQALVHKDSPYAYFVHCFAHILQITLVASLREVVPGIIDEPSTTFTQRADADAGYVNLKSFDFVFILHLIKEVMGRTNILSYSLQKKSQDILNAIELVKVTKDDLNDFRNNKWDSFLTDVTSFFNKHQVDIPDMNAPYTSTRYRPRKKDNQVTFEHYYRVDLFKATVDKQLYELNARFNYQTMELLNLSSTLVSKEDPKPNNPKLSGASPIVDLCKSFAETQLRDEYYLLDRVVRLILTLPVSTTTTERGFSAMKIFKNRLRNKMSDDYLANNLVIYIEKELAESFDSTSVIDEFKELKGRRAEL